MQAATKIRPVTVAVDPSNLAAALKAVRAFTSDDPTRYVLQCICADAKGSKLTLTATDGHTLCSITLDCTTDVEGRALLTEIWVDTLLLGCKAAKGLSATNFELDSMDGTFPDYNQVIPAKEDNAKGTLVHGFDGILPGAHRRCAEGPEGAARPDPAEQGRDRPAPRGHRGLGDGYRDRDALPAVDARRE